MLFNSINFIVYFPIVVLLYFVIPKKIRYIWLLGASYFFLHVLECKIFVIAFVFNGDHLSQWTFD